MQLQRARTNRLRPDDGVGYSRAVTSVVVGFEVVEDAGDGLRGFLGRGFGFRRKVQTPQDLSLQLLHLVELGVVLKHIRRNY